nr:MAG TPA: hypothetical protein [Bacteriophage sp.]
MLSSFDHRRSSSIRYLGSSKQSRTSRNSKTKFKSRCSNYFCLRRPCFCYSNKLSFCFIVLYWLRHSKLKIPSIYSLSTIATNNRRSNSFIFLSFSILLIRINYIRCYSRHWCL